MTRRVRPGRTRGFDNQSSGQRLRADQMISRRRADPGRWTGPRELLRLILLLIQEDCRSVLSLPLRSGREGRGQQENRKEM